MIIHLIFSMSTKSSYILLFINIVIQGGDLFVPEDNWSGLGNSYRR